MKRFLLLLLLLLAIQPVNAQVTTFTPVCGGVDDTARFVALIAAIGANDGTIELPFKNGTRCAVNSLTVPGNVTLDNTRGTGLKVNSGQVLTMLGATISPAGRPLFFGPGTVNFTGNTLVGNSGQALVSDGLGGVFFATISGGGGGGGLVNSVFGRTGDVAAATGDYTWNQIDKTVSSLADITLRSANLLSNGTTGTGQVVLHDSPVIINGTINGIGFAGTAGRTLTVNNSLTLGAASEGLSGVIPASGTFAMGAATLSVSSTTNAGTANHSHAITSSSNPGAAASILASNASGHLQLTRLGIGIAPTQPLEVNGNILVSAATANLFLKDTATGLQAATTGVITPQSGNAIRSTSFTSGLVGWGINAGGDAEFANVDVRGAIRSSIFTYNAINATAGTLGVYKSAAKLLANVTIPAGLTYGTTTVSIDVEDADGLTHASSQLFAVGDILRLKDGLVGDTWVRVSAATDQTTFWRYTAVVMAGSANVTYRAGLGIPDYGPSGQGFIELTADRANAPHQQMATHTATFTSQDLNGTLNVIPRLRVGNLNGSYGFGTDTFGFAAGTYGVAGQSWIIVDPANGVRIGNNTTTLTHVDSAGNASFSGSVTASSGTIAGWSILSDRLSSGSTHVASNFDAPAGPMAWFGQSTTGHRGIAVRDAGGREIDILANNGSIFPYFNVSDGTRTRVVIGGLNNNWCNDGATASMGMKVCDAAGNLLVHFSNVQNTIGNWTITTTRISAGSGATTVGMDATVTGGDDVRFFAGNATPASAPFRVTEAGALTASNASITGTVTATSGTIGGWTIGATSLISGSGATTVAMDSGGTNPAFYAGSATPGSAPFRVTNTGALTATNATITGAITATSGSFTGSITSTAGTIGGFTIATNRLSAGSGATTVGLDSTVTGGDDVRFFAGSATLGSAPFRVTEAGVLTATNANITSAGGDVIIDSSGMRLTFGTGAARTIRWMSGANAVGTISSSPGSGFDSIAVGATALTATNSSIASLSAANSLGLSSILEVVSSDSNPTPAPGVAYVRMRQQGGSSFDFIGLHIGGTNTPQAMLDVNSDSIRIANPKTPASATAACARGMMAWDTNFVYVCVATNSWKRSAISTW